MQIPFEYTALGIFTMQYREKHSYLNSKVPVPDQRYLHYKKKILQRCECIEYFLHFPPLGLKKLHQTLYCHRVEQPKEDEKSNAIN